MAFNDLPIDSNEIPDLDSAVGINVPDLFLMRQGVTDKKVSKAVLEQYIVPNEVTNAIISMGLTSTVTAESIRLAQAIAAYVADNSYYVDTGSTSNVYELEAVGSRQVPASYTDGATYKFNAIRLNTGAAVARIGTLTNKSIRDSEGEELTGGELIGQVVLQFDLANNYFKLPLLIETTPKSMVSAFATSTAPDGWLLCNGSAIDRVIYDKLFAEIGTVFGTTTGSNFRVPDLRGEFIRGWDNGRGVDSGRGFGTTQADQIASHRHTVAAGFIGGSGDTEGGSGRVSSSSNSGFFGGNETRPRNIALNYCIKY